MFILVWGEQINIGEALIRVLWILYYKVCLQSFLIQPTWIQEAGTRPWHYEGYCSMFKIVWNKTKVIQVFNYAGLGEEMCVMEKINLVLLVVEWSKVLFELWNVCFEHPRWIIAVKETFFNKVLECHKIMPSLYSLSFEGQGSFMNNIDIIKGCQVSFLKIWRKYFCFQWFLF